MSVTAPSSRSRWWALAVISIAQLMVVLDGSIVNIALPRAQADLGFDDASRQWVVTAYSLAFGALLLLGGRIGDLFGRKRAFLIGLIGFAVASAVGGIAPNIEVLLTARTLQGAFGALLAPSALSLLAVTFTDARERATAFGVFAAVAGGGGAIGLLLGGVLTEFASWRWTLLINVVFALVAVIGSVLIREIRAEQRGRIDIPGVVLVSAGLAALVFGFSRAETDGWTGLTTLVSFAAAIVLLVAFVFVESRVADPLLPLSVVLDRNRGGAYLSGGLAMTGMFGQFLFLAFYLQGIEGFTPLQSGLAFLPLVVFLIIGSTVIGPRLATVVTARVQMGLGFLVGAIGLVLLTLISPEGSYWNLVLPGEIVLGLGMGVAFTLVVNVATAGVRPEHAGTASAMINTSQQVGGSIGTALLSTIAAGATTAWAATNTAAGPQAAAVHGYAIAFAAASGLMLLASIAAFSLIRVDTRTVADAPHDADRDVHADADTVAVHA